MCPFLVCSCSPNKHQRGHIYTSFGSFFIEPVEPYTADNPLVLHRINRMVTHVSKATTSNNSSSSSSDGVKPARTMNVTCDVAGTSHANDVAVAVTTTPPPPPTAESSHLRRKKRNILSPASAPHLYHHHVQPTNAYTMKVLVGVDTKMQDYHRENGRNLKEYILTLMSIVRNCVAFGFGVDLCLHNTMSFLWFLCAFVQVSSVYSDPSIGNAINIAVVDIVHTGTLVTPPHPGSNQGIKYASLPAAIVYYISNAQPHHDDCIN